MSASEEPRPRPAPRTRPARRSPTDELLTRAERIRREMGGERRIAAMHEAGRLTAREHIDGLIDPGSFQLGTFARSGDRGPRQHPRRGEDRRAR